MGHTRKFLLIAFLGLFLGNFSGSALEIGYDSGVAAPRFSEEYVEGLGLSAEDGPWVRVRGLRWWSLRAPFQEPFQPQEPSLSSLPEGWQSTLGELRRKGFFTVGMLRWGSATWKSGTREADGHRFPLDLREAYQRAYWQGFLGLGLIDAWEIDNEPDLTFSQDPAHAYASFLNACHRGIVDGAKARLANMEKRGRYWFEGGVVQRPRKFFRPQAGIGLRLRCGEEQLAGPMVWGAAMGLPPGPFFESLLACGFYPASDVIPFHYYGMPEHFAAVAQRFRDASGKNSLPVVLTEYGYGLLSGDASQTAEGRERQRAYFEAMLPELSRSGVDVAMAFVLMPYLERDFLEFGLTERQPDGSLRPVPALNTLQVSGKTFGNSASKGFLKNFARTQKSPAVVQDFIAGEGLRLRVSRTQYQVTEFRGPNATFQADWVLTNLSDEEVTLTDWQVAAEGRSVSIRGLPSDDDIRFGPWERKVIPLQAVVWAGTLDTIILQSTADEEVQPLEISMLVQKPGEPPGDASDFLATDNLPGGVTVTFDEGSPTWKLFADSLPQGPLQPVVWEIPLRSDAPWDPVAFFRLHHRILSGADGFRVYLRNADGSLMGFWYRIPSSDADEGKSDIFSIRVMTPVFYAPVSLWGKDWERPPQSLVILCYPRELPLEIQIDEAVFYR